MKNPALFLLLSMAVSPVVLVGCNKETQTSAEAPSAKPPPPAVNVEPVRFQTIPLIKEFSGRTVPYEEADVRPQVTGVVDKISFRQGSLVEKGQELYHLSIENYEADQAANQAAVQQALANVNTAIANYNNAVANIASREAELEQASNDVERLEPLVSQQAISEQQFEQTKTRFRMAQAAYNSAEAQAKQAEASIASAKAAVATANARLAGSELDISRTIVRAPITGASGRSNVTAGALVNANQAEPLVTITRLDPIYVEISLSSAELLSIQKRQNSGEIDAGSNEVQLILEDGTVYPAPGKLSLTEARVNGDTGSVIWRATFPNPNYILLPGMYAKARLVQGVLKNAVLLPQSALIRTPKGGAQVYIVDEKHIVHARDVTIDGTFEGLWVVTSGLSAGEQLITVGASKVSADQEVTIRPPSSTSPSTSSAPPSTANPSASPSGNASSKSSPNNSSKAAPASSAGPVALSSQTSTNRQAVATNTGGASTNDTATTDTEAAR